MKAMILAAGRGERMRPLTDTTPKPLLEVRGKALIVWHIQKLAKNGFKDIIINIAHLGEMIPKALGDGREWGVRLSYSDERDSGALESAGGIKKALHFFENETFFLVNGDVWCDYEFDSGFDLGDDLAHLILVANPEHNLSGDFALKDDRVLNEAEDMYTYSGIGYYSPKLFDSLADGKNALAPVLRKAIEKNKVSGSLHVGVWRDIGTPQRLKEIDNYHI